jgi:alpha-L-fucosidase 2
LFISAATSFNGYDKSPDLQGKGPSVAAIKYLDAAFAKTFENLKETHIKDYQSIFRRASFYLGESINKDLPTDVRLKNMKTYTDPELVAQIAQFGRYILIAGSRPGGQPVNLKGIWNERLRPEYSSNWCIDHDAQMFYYAVETTNLPELHEPFLQFIEDLSKNGRKTAAINYGMHGWCAHHNADIWRCSNPVGNYGEGNPHWATWNMSGPWLCAHLFDHYLFTGDKKYLATKAWPVMKGAAEFCLDWLVEKEGHLISVPSVSPENTFITEYGDTAQISVNTTSDIALIKQLFTNCIQTIEIINSDKDFANTLTNALQKLAPYAIGSKNQLLEFEKEWKQVDPSHRHLSHMYAVFPGNEISPIKTPALSDAAKNALSLREKTNCSWGFAWKAACWARLGEADSAWQTWQYQLQYVDPKSTSSLNNYGLFPNFFNSDGRDVIMNGNGCATAVLTEMILQSHTGEIQFLPALPTIFKDGNVKGLCAQGGFVVDISWHNKQLTTANIFSKLGNECKLRITQPVVVYEGKNRISIFKKEKGLYSFKTVKGKHYLIKSRRD